MLEQRRINSKLTLNKLRIKTEKENRARAAAAQTARVARAADATEQ